jgi:hypothetical protein
MPTSKLLKAYAEGLNTLAVCLCTSGLQILKGMPRDEVESTLSKAVEDCLVFVRHLRRAVKTSQPPMDLPKAESELERVKKALGDPQLFEEKPLAALRRSIRAVSLRVLGVGLPEHRLGVDGAVCELHGADCPPKLP